MQLNTFRYDLIQANKTELKTELKKDNKFRNKLIEKNSHSSHSSNKNNTFRSNFFVPTTSKLCNHQTTKKQEEETKKKPSTYLITYDKEEYLIQSIQFENLTLPAETTYQLTKQRNRHYLKTYELRINGQIVAYYLAEPLEGNKTRYDRLNIANPIFYLENKKEIKKQLFLDFNIKNAKLTQLHLAYDSTGIAEKFSFYFYKKKMQKLTLRNTHKLRSNIAPVSMKDDIDLIYSCTIGMRESKKYYTIYAKSQETDKDKKVYIKEYWERNKLNSNNVDRLELRLSRDILKTIALDVDKMEDQNYIENLFFYYANKDLNFVDQTKKTYDLNRNLTYKKIPFIQMQIKNHKPPIFLDKINALDSVTAKQNYVSESYKAYILTGDAKYYDTMIEYIHLYHLGNWFLNRNEYWYKAQYKANNVDYKLHTDVRAKVQQLELQLSN